MKQFDSTPDGTAAAEQQPLPSLDSPETNSDDLATEPLVESGFEDENPLPEFE